tara:strand:- start:97 stop:333 length:237 start_codon:yes stop_codon:yes gene_type:complete
MSGDIETFKSLPSEDFTFILNGELDISQTYDWDKYMKFAAYFGSLLKGEVGAEFGKIIAGGNAAIIFNNGNGRYWREI